MSRKSKIITAVVLIAAIGALAWLGQGMLDKPVQVKTMKLARGDIRVTVSATTTSTIESDRRVTISAQRMGTISRMPIEEGDFVTAGQVIAELDRADALAELRQSEAELELAQDRLEQTKAGVLMQVGQSGSTLAEAASMLKESEKDLERTRKLFDRGMISRREQDAAERSSEVAKARYESAKAGLDINKVKEKDVLVAKAAVKQAEAAVGLVKVQLGYCVIKAPVSGVISKRPVDLGEMVTIGTPVAEIVDPKDIYVLSTIDEVDVTKLRLGMKVKVHVDALPDKLLDGAISRISPIVVGDKQQTRTFAVRTLFAEESPLLKPGMSADIEAMSSEIKGVLHVPAQAVVDNQGKKSVYVVAEGKAKLSPVTLGFFNWSDAEIKGGVKEGETVITTPDAVGLKDGAKVVEASK